MSKNPLVDITDNSVFIEVFSYVESNLFVDLLIKKDFEYLQKLQGYLEKLKLLESYIEENKEDKEGIDSFEKLRKNLEKIAQKIEKMHGKIDEIMKKYDALSDVDKKNYMEKKFDYLENPKKIDGLNELLSAHFPYEIKKIDEDIPFLFPSQSSSKETAENEFKFLEKIYNGLISLETNNEKNSDISILRNDRTALRGDIFVILPFLFLNGKDWELLSFDLNIESILDMKKKTYEEILSFFNECIILDKKTFDPDIYKFILSYSKSKIDLTCDARLIFKKRFSEKPQKQN